MHKAGNLWFRKAFKIPKALKLSHPSLFLGLVKDEGWVYLDGKLIGSAGRETFPFTLRLLPDQIIPGNHTLAVRVFSKESAYPGLYHSRQKGIAIVDYSESIQESLKWQQMYFHDAASIFIQLVALTIVLLLVVRSNTENEVFLWLSGYFAPSCIYSILEASLLSWRVAGQSCAIIMMSASLACYASFVLDQKKSHGFPIRWTIFLAGALAVITRLIALQFNSLQFLNNGPFDQSLSIISRLHYLWHHS